MNEENELLREQNELIRKLVQSLEEVKEGKIKAFE